MMIGGRYELASRLQAGDRTRGIPELWRATDLGELYYVKVWRRRPGDSDDLLALWNREVRSLMRLQGYPGAGELFVNLRDLGFSEKEFYVVLEGGRRLPLSEALADRSRHNILTNLGEVNRRRGLWEGLLRTAEALSILHNEGTLHRALAPSSIFISSDGNGDFRLSGFEWSLRISGTDGASTSVSRSSAVRAPELDHPDGEFSTGTDWYDFGLICAEVFGVGIAARKKRTGIIEAISQLAGLRDSEKRLMQRLLAENPEHRFFTGEEVLAEMRNIVRDLNITAGSGGRDLILALRLDPESEFCRTIERISSHSAPARDQLAQIRWITHDLRGDVRVTARQSHKLFVVRGERLEYRVRQWSLDGLITWDVGFCESAEYSPRMLDDDQVYSIGDRRLDIMTFTQARKNLSRIRDRSASWERVFPFRTGRKKLPPELAEIHDFFRITQQLDVVLIAAKICPVRILAVTRAPTSTQVIVTPFEEPERSELARYLRLGSPSELLKDWSELGASPLVVYDDQDPKKARFSFLERRTIGGDGGADRWRFAGGFPDPQGPRYIFESPGAAPIREGYAYLASDHGGALAQVRRRNSAIEALRSYQGLLRLIAAPQDASRDGSEKLPNGRSDLPLDEAKLTSLERLWRLRPSFAVQGPPGTGKTTLISAFADRLLDFDPSSQILITAHSHHTVDDVRLKLTNMFKQTGVDPIVVRVGAKQPTDHDVDRVTACLLEKLAASELVAGAPKFLADRISAAASGENTRDVDVGPEIGTMQMLVQDSANLTFSTLNSGDLFELNERGRHFDWSIIEEAGKAHGFDMAVALQESHRLLMIGDHYQLPPFNARLYQSLLRQPHLVQKAIQAGARFAPGLVDPSLVDDDGDMTKFEEKCAQWARMVTLFGEIFNRSLGTTELPGPAAMLTDQHRMHPDIADLVGRIFYPSEDGSQIKSSDETRRRFAAPPPFVIKNPAILPEQRVIWWNVPWVQKDHFAEGETDGIFASNSEAKAVIEVLDQFQDRDGVSCELQILSPYTDQIAAIRGVIDSAYGQGRLQHMFVPPFSLKEGKRMGATVDEFQGSEADIVVVSLVRNNALVPWRSLGFLKERTRMNVLLSRAKHKLIIVGSWKFFSSRRVDTTTQDDDYYYITEMMAEMDRALKRGTLGLAGSPV
jgi:serine/threonine protein kinase